MSAATDRVVAIGPDPEAIELCAAGAMTVKRAAEFSGISRSRLFELIRDAELPVIRNGRTPLIPRAALVAYLARHLEQ